MFRLLPLLAFLLVPAALIPPGAAPSRPVAAPVPRDAGRPAFGANGFVTRADLEKVKFDTRRYAGRSDEPAAPKLAGLPRDYDLAVHLPWAKFREGEPMPAYFVARNNLDRGLGLVEYPQLFGPQPILTESCDIYVVDKATGKRVGGPLYRISCQRKRSGDEVIPAKGYYVVKGDLAGMGGEPLPAGEYEVQWQFATGDQHGTRFAAAPVTFTVEKVEGAKPGVAKQPEVQLFALCPHPDHEPIHPLAWRLCQLMPVHEAAAVLGLGRCGVYIPDVYTIPAADKVLTVSAQWKPYRNEDRVAITLHSAQPGRRVRFTEIPNFYLQVEIPDGPARDLQAGATSKFGMEVDGKELVTPLMIEMRLPDGWREQLEATNTARVAVVVASERLEWDRDRVKKIDGEIPAWTGVLRTAFTELRFPPALPSRER